MRVAADVREASALARCSVKQDGGNAEKEQAHGDEGKHADTTTQIHENK